MFGNLGTGELLIILLIVLVFFGAKKIPDLASGLGKGIRSFKKAINGEDENTEKGDDKKELKG
ncbi:MAG TPA: twin-arginine translocase TatA/TatE family subunit [Bacteroidota bacterium]|jgi:sec-independent protein translocase protein TatA|nr:twin-arginine translocase TatA/TatE family subunit [Bacteroidota bacterium]